MKGEDRAVKLLKAGCTVQHIAQTLDITVRQVREIAKAHGLRVMERRR
jgi:DNA-binding NarL/FixJ family response regulator